MTGISMFSMRFDLRAAPGGVQPPALYRAALEMCEWAETRGGLAVSLTEHHMDKAGYLPSPLVMASAIAARTKTLSIMVAIFQLPLYSPIKLAEDMCVLDNISEGRVQYV